MNAVSLSLFEKKSLGIFVCERDRKCVYREELDLSKTPKPLVK